MWPDSTAQRRYVMDGITELACFLRKNRDLSIENSLRLSECTLAPSLLGTGDNLAGKRVQKTHGSLCQMQQGGLADVNETSTALFTFPKDRGGLQIKMPRAITCSAAWGHLTRCCQFDDGTRQLAEITYKDALENTGAWIWKTSNSKRNSLLGTR